MISVIAFGLSVGMVLVFSKHCYDTGYERGHEEGLEDGKDGS